MSLRDRPGLPGRERAAPGVSITRMFRARCRHWPMNMLPGTSIPRITRARSAHLFNDWSHDRHHATASYVVPPQRAVWVPAGEVHEVHRRGKVSCRTLYVQPQAASDLPSTRQVIEVSDLLRS